MSLTCQKHLFSLPEEVTYLNVAYQGPMLKSAEKIGHDELNKRRFPIDITKSDFFDPPQQVRRQFSDLINAGDATRIALMPSVSYGISTVAKNIPVGSGQNIVLVGEQFPSNYYPWERLAAEKNAELRIIAPPHVTDSRGRVWNERILEAIDANTAVVSMANVHWSDGTLFNLMNIGTRCRETGAYFIVDGTQSIGALPFDLQEIGADAVICAGYKWLLGPYGMAFGYFGEKFDAGVPIEENWINRFESDRFENLVNYESRYREKAGRYNAGEFSNFVHVAMLNDSLRQIAEWTPAAIQDYCRDLQQPFIQPMVDLGLSLEADKFRSHHLFGVRLPAGADANRISEELAAQKIFVSVRGNAIRLAPHLYNEARHFENLIDVLRNLL